jgi:hypothetical protein
MARPEQVRFDDLPILGELRELLRHRMADADALAAPAPGRLRAGLSVLPILSATAVALAVVLAAFLLIRPHDPGQPAPASRHHEAPRPPHVPTPPPPTAVQKDVSRAEQRTIATDHACRQPVNRGSTFSQGSPGQPFLSQLGVLRRPAPPRDQTWRTLFDNGFDAGAEVYVNYIRRARSAYGDSFYIIPEGHTTPFGPIPSRCYAEQTKTLRRLLRGASATVRGQALRLLSEQISIQRSETEHRAGLCFASVSRHHRGRMGGVGFGCSPGTQALAGGTNGGQGFGDRAGGVIEAAIEPDRVASVTLAYSAGDGDPARQISSQTVNNVVVFKIPPNTAHKDFPTSVILRGHDGQVIGPNRRYQPSAAFP